MAAHARETRAPVRAPRGGLRALLGAAAAGGVLALGGMLVAGGEPVTAAVQTPDLSSLTPTVPPTISPTGTPADVPATRSGEATDEDDGPVREVVDPQTPAAVAFLAALREADVPTSRSGAAEVEIAGAVCVQLGQETSEDDLARAIPRVLPTVTRAQAADLVDAAAEHYC